MLVFKKYIFGVTTVTGVGALNLGRSDFQAVANNVLRSRTVGDAIAQNGNRDGHESRINSAPQNQGQMLPLQPPAPISPTSSTSSGQSRRSDALTIFQAINPLAEALSAIHSHFNPKPSPEQCGRLIEACNEMEHSRFEFEIQKGQVQGQYDLEDLRHKQHLELLERDTNALDLQKAYYQEQHALQNAEFNEKLSQCMKHVDAIKDQIAQGLQTKNKQKWDEFVSSMKSLFYIEQRQHNNSLQATRTRATASVEAANRKIAAVERLNQALEEQRDSCQKACRLARPDDLRSQFRLDLACCLVLGLVLHCMLMAVFDQKFPMMPAAGMILSMFAVYVGNSKNVFKPIDEVNQNGPANVD